MFRRKKDEVEYIKVKKSDLEAIGYDLKMAYEYTKDLNSGVKYLERLNRHGKAVMHDTDVMALRAAVDRLSRTLEYWTVMVKSEYLGIRP